MAVFPYARRALARPSRLPWLIAAAALIAVTLSIPGYSVLHETARSIQLPLAAETSSTATRATSSVRTIDTSGEDVPANATLVTADLQALFDNLAASDASMVAQEAALIVLPLSETADDAGSGYVSEVSSASTVAGQGESVAGPVTQASTATDTPGTAAPVPAAQTAAELPPPAQPLVTSFASPIQRWAAAGIYIETQDQLLDDASLANVDAALSALPAGLLSSLGNPAFGPMHILVNTEGRVLSGDQPYGGPANFFSTNEATNELVLYPQQSVFTIVHELGHAYNLRHVGAGKYAMVLLDPEMRSFLAATGWTINSSDDEIRAAVDHMHVSYSYSGSFHWPRLSNDDPLEDFANTFATYFLDPQALQQQSPARYAWMASTFGQ